MTSVNRLYGVLTLRLAGAYQDDYYVKLHTPVRHTGGMERLCDAFLGNVPDGRLRMFACVVCRAALTSRFGPDIAELDPENTYLPVSRPPDAAPEDPDLLVFDLVMPEKSFRSLYRYLDEDILARLQLPTWQDMAGAVCLQLMRGLEDA